MKFATLAIEEAPAQSRPLMSATAKLFGFVPDPVARAARSPALLGWLLSGFRAFDQSSLSALEREVIAMTVAYENGCSYCMALHSSALSRDPANASVLEALRTGHRLGDARLDAIRDLALDLLRERSSVPAPELSAENALDVALGVGVYALSTMTNIFTGAELDPAFAAFAWTKPGPERRRAEPQVRTVAAEAVSPSLDAPEGP